MAARARRLRSHGEANAVPAPALTVEIPFVYGGRPYGLLVLAEKEGESIWPGDEYMELSSCRTAFAQTPELLDRRLGQHPGVPAASDRLLGRSTLGAAVQNPANAGRLRLDESANTV